MNRFADERGESLIEIMITIMVMAVGMVAVIGAIGSSIIASDAHHSLAQGEVVVRDYGDSIKATAASLGDYIKCPTSIQLDPTPGTDAVDSDLAGSGWNAKITHVAWWVPDSSSFPNGTWTPDDNSSACTAYFNTCVDASNDLAACDAGLQRVTFEVWNSRTDYGKMTIEGRVLTRRNNAP
jgi:Tfp pilus assembly protein PilV